MKLKDHEMRLAIHQTLDCDASQFIECRTVPFRETGKMLDVNLFELDGHPTARRCYVWSVKIDEKITVGPVIVQDPVVDTPEKAVAAYDAKRRE
jgi:hypothetical protein